MDKNELLNKLYYDPSGLQSQQRLYKEAKKKDNKITIKDVKEWYANNIEKTRYVGSNSFVAPHAHYEYHIDLSFITDLENQTYKIGMAFMTCSQNMQPWYQSKANNLQFPSWSHGMLNQYEAQAPFYL